MNYCVNCGKTSYSCAQDRRWSHKSCCALCTHGRSADTNIPKEALQKLTESLCKDMSPKEVLKLSGCLVEDMLWQIHKEPKMKRLPRVHSKWSKGSPGLPDVEPLLFSKVYCALRLTLRNSSLMELARKDYE